MGRYDVSIRCSERWKTVFFQAYPSLFKSTVVEG